ncbi:MAG: DUF58 domain-containing protein [Vicinamibacteria bacterium]|nr:DUF58 domain-containing protein [Vicinamibacteria bacterium]
MLRAARWLRRVAAHVRAWWPLTTRGALALALAGLALWALGLRALDFVVFVVGLAGLLVAGMALAACVVAGLSLRRRLLPPPLNRNLESDVLLPTGFDAPGLARLPLVSLGWSWQEPAGIECLPRQRDGRLVEEVRASLRGHARAVRRRFTVGDVFGLVRVSWERETPAALTILPNPGRLRHVSVVDALAGGEGLPHPSGTPDGDRMDLRRYAPGDSARHILWKVWARTGKLTVRLPERALVPARKTVAFLVTDEADEAAAAAARVALESGSLGADWAFGCDGSPEPTDDLDGALLAIARSGGLRRAGADLPAFLEAAWREGAAHCVVFAPAAPGAWIANVHAAARLQGGRLSFVICAESVARDRPEPLWRRLLLASGEAAEATPASALADTLRQVAALGAGTLVVERRTGRSYGAAHAQALRG